MVKLRYRLTSWELIPRSLNGIAVKRGLEQKWHFFDNQRVIARSEIIERAILLTLERAPVCIVSRFRTVSRGLKIRVPYPIWALLAAHDWLPVAPHQPINRESLD